MPPTRKVKRRKGAPTSKVRQFRLGEGLPPVRELRAELAEMREVLLGREEPPISVGVMTMQEVAEGYFSRACEMEQLILDAEHDGRVAKKDHYYSFRTQTLRSFKEQAKSAAELGSRRLTWEALRYQQETTGRESG
jgi:hypothetical protein